MISIVIPVYNSAAYLSDMLNSVIEQSYKDVEIILVNDGSTDDSSAVCHRYADKYSYVRVYDRENHGASASRNYGVKMANGEFIWFMDSDDILKKDALLNSIEAQSKYDADIVIGGMNFSFLEEGRVIPKTIQNDVVLNDSEFKCLYNELFSANYISSLWNKLIRKSVITENSILMNESLHMYEDYVFCMDILLKCKTIVCLSKIFYDYKLRYTKSLSHSYKENVIDMFCILEKKIAEYKETFKDEAPSTQVALDNLLIYLAYECVKNEARHKNAYKKIKNILRNEAFKNAMRHYSATGKRYKTVQMLMKKRMALLLLTYLKITKKV